MKVKADTTEQIEFLMRAGKDIVRSATLPGNIQRMIDTAETVEESSEYPGFPICVNGKFYLPKIAAPAEAEPAPAPKRKKGKS